MTNLILRRHLAAKNNKKKGFTLIELIVVIVIIAIIAAIAVPALTKYIGSAEQRQVQAMAHNIQLVLQAERTDQYTVPVFANGTDASVVAYTGGSSYESILNSNGIALNAVTDLTTITWGGNIEEKAYDNTVLTGFVYSNGKYSVTYAINTGFQAPVAVTP